MNTLINSLRNYVSNKQATFTCYTIDNNKTPFVGSKIELSHEQLKNFMTKTISYLCDKVYSTMNLGEYPAASPKEYIETLSCSDEKISTYIKGIENIISNPETNVTDFSKYNAYMIVIQIDKEPIIFITKKKIMHKYKKAFCFSSKDYTEVNNELIRLIMHFDCFIIDNTCYIITKQGRTMFHLEETLAQKSKAIKEHMISMDIFKREKIEQYMKKPGHATCLANIDRKLLDVFKNITAENKDLISQKYRLPIIEIDDVLKVDTSDGEKMNNFIDTLTNKRGKNFDDEIVYSASSFSTIR